MAVLASLAVGQMGCAKGAKTPEDAYARFVAAVEARDPARLYDALDLETRWSWMSVRRAQREGYDIVLSNFPEGPGRDREAARFEAGALSADEASLFAKHWRPERWEELARGLAAGAAVTRVSDDEAYVGLAEGRKARLRRGENERWGYAGLAEEAEQLKRRALADLEVIRASAADYERAATRAGSK